MKEVHLSDGAMQAIRDDLEWGPDGELTAESAYIAKSLDEILWLRQRELGLERRIHGLQAQLERANMTLEALNPTVGLYKVIDKLLAKQEDLAGQLDRATEPRADGDSQ